VGAVSPFPNTGVVWLPGRQDYPVLRSADFNGMPLTFFYQQGFLFVGIEHEAYLLGRCLAGTIDQVGARKG
jgi:hypothetical protein